MRLYNSAVLGLNGVEGSVVFSPSPAIVTDGEPFTLTCTYSGSETVIGFTWELNGYTIATLVLPACAPFTPPGSPDATLYEYDCVTDKLPTFTVKRISNNNNGNNWKCLAAVPGYIYSNNVTIIVQVVVKSVILTPPSSIIIEGIETSFTCETSTSRPSATVMWYKESSSGQKEEIINKTASSTVHQGDRDLIKTKSVLKYRSSRSDNGYKMYCEAINMAGRSPVTSSKLSMNVLYNPDGPPKIQDYPDGSNYKVIENNQGRLECIIEGGNPLATLTWSCFNNRLSTITNGIEVIKIVKWNATRGTDRSCTCLSSHLVALTQTVSVNVHVLYMAVVTSFTIQQNQSHNQLLTETVNEYDHVKFECVVDSNPGSTIQIQTWNKTLTRQENSNTLAYNLGAVDCLDTGVYTCSANNQYNSGKSSEKKLNMFVRCSPRPLSVVKENESCIHGYPATLTFKALAYPAPTYTWMKKEVGEWRRLSNSSNISISISEEDTNLTIHKVSLKNHGDYRLEIENEIDIYIQSYYLIEEKIEVPGAPNGFHVVKEHISDTFALLRWKPGFNGGTNQTFILMYKGSSDQDWSRTTVEDTQEGLIIYTLHHLDSSSEYTVMLIARNQVGESLSSQNITFSTKETKTDSLKGDNSAISGGVIGGIVGGVVVLCVLVVLVLCFLVRRGILSCEGPVKETSNKTTLEDHGQDFYSRMNIDGPSASHVYDSLQTGPDVTSDLSNKSVYMDLHTNDDDNTKNVYTELGI